MADTREWRHLYGRAAWKRLRSAHLAQQPLCAFCLRQEVVTEAAVVDHVNPHKGDEALFFDASNLQSLCKSCHDSIKQRLELGRSVVMYGPDGWPI